MTLALLLGAAASFSPRSYAHTKEPAQTSASGDASDSVKREKHHGSALLEEAAAVLGISKQELRDSLKDKTLVQIAAARKISEADLIAKLKEARVKRLDEAVAAGKLSAEQAARKKEKLDSHLKFIVNHKLGDLSKHRGFGRHKGGMLPAPDKLAAILGITTEELKSQLKDGKSLADIAQSKGMTKDQLVAKIKDEMTPWIEQAVERKGKTGDKQGSEKK